MQPRSSLALDWLPAISSGASEWYRKRFQAASNFNLFRAGTSVRSFNRPIYTRRIAT
jgi:hypothetical protein